MFFQTAHYLAIQLAAARLHTRKYAKRSFGSSQLVAQICGQERLVSRTPRLLVRRVENTTKIKLRFVRIGLDTQVGRSLALPTKRRRLVCTQSQRVRETSGSRIAATVLCAFAIGCTTAPTPSKPALEGANIVLVMVDTLRADHLGSFGYARPTSPFLDQLADASIAFSNVVAPASQTVPSMLSLWSGVYPNQHGNQYFPGIRAFRVPTPNTEPKVPDDLPLMAEYLQARGYRTAAVVTNPWLRKSYGFARGFEVYHHLEAVPAPRGPAINDLAREIIDRWKGEKFLLYLHYMDVHIPFDPKPKYRADFPPIDGPSEAISQLKASYEAEIRAIDDYTKEILSELKRAGLADDTLIVFTADHGEEFDEHGGIGHGHALFQELVHVPLMLIHPKLASRYRKIAQPISLVDVFPTVAELVATGDAPPADGRSLVPLIANEDVEVYAKRTLFSELGTATSAVKRGKKLIRTTKKNTTDFKAFDLTEDPRELNPIASGPPWINELRAALQQHAKRTRSQESDNSFGKLDPEVEERVRALGY